MKRLIKKILREDSFPRGGFNVTGTYHDVKPYYNFISQGPTPGRERGPGFNYKSKGPEGVNYFMEEDGDEVNPWAVCTTSLGLEGKKKKDYSTKEKNKYEKCVMSVKGKLKENRINYLVDKILKEEGVLNEKHWCGGDDGGWCTDSQFCKCVGSNCGCEDMNMNSMFSDKGSGFVNKQGGSERLNKFNRRQIGESNHGSSYMAKKQLWSIAEKAEDMAKRLPDNTQLEDWMESHIAKADSMMDSVYDSFDYDNQTEIPGFEETMNDLNNLSIREEEDIASSLYQQDTSHRDVESGKVIASTEMLDIMDSKLDNLTNVVNDLYDNLSRRWS